MALLTGSFVCQWEVKSIRLWLVRVAGNLVVSGRQLILKLPESILHQKEWLKWEQMSLTVTLYSKLIEKSKFAKSQWGECVLIPNIIYLLTLKVYSKTTF